MQKDWWGDAGELKMTHRPIDPEELLREKGVQNS
jgi:hypothetical protein